MARAVVSIDRVGQSIYDDDNCLDDVGQFVERVGVSLYRVFNSADDIFNSILDGGKCVDENGESIYGDGQRLLRWSETPSNPDLFPKEMARQPLDRSLAPPILR